MTQDPFLKTIASLDKKPAPKVVEISGQAARQRPDTITATARAEPPREKEQEHPEVKAASNLPIYVVVFGAFLAIGILTRLKFR